MHMNLDYKPAYDLDHLSYSFFLIGSNIYFWALHALPRKMYVAMLESIVTSDIVWGCILWFSSHWWRFFIGSLEVFVMGES